MSSPPLQVLLPGSPGRWPFAGHVRGRWSAPAAPGGVAPVELAWAGRIGWGCPPEDAWEAAEALRAAFAEAVRGIVVVGAPALGGGGMGPAGATSGAVARMQAKVRSIEARWLQREDLSYLLAARDDRGVWLAGCGLAGVLVEGPGGWAAAVLPGAPVLGEPGIPPADAPPQPPHRTGARFVAIPAGLTPPPAERLLASCGAPP